MFTFDKIKEHKAKVIKTEFQEQEIFVKEFTSVIRQKFMNQSDFLEQQIVVLTECLCADEKGEPFFSEEEKKELYNINPSYLDELFNVVIAVATGKDDREVAGN